MTLGATVAPACPSVRPSVCPYNRHVEIRNKLWSNRRSHMWMPRFVSLCHLPEKEISPVWIKLNPISSAHYIFLCKHTAVLWKQHIYNIIQLQRCTPGVCPCFWIIWFTSHYVKKSYHCFFCSDFVVACTVFMACSLKKRLPELIWNQLSSEELGGVVVARGVVCVVTQMCHICFHTVQTDSWSLKNSAPKLCTTEKDLF